MNKKLVSMLLAGGIFFLLPFFVNPWAIWNGFDEYQELQISTPKLMGMFLVATLVFSVYLSQKIHWLLGVVFAVFNINTLLSGFGAMQILSSLYLISMVMVGLWFVELQEWQKGIIFKAIILSGIVSGLYALSQHLGFDPLFTYGNGVDPTTTTAFFGQNTKYGIFMAMCFAIALAYDYTLISIFLCVMALLSSSSMTFAALLAVFIVRSRRWNYGRIISSYTLVGAGISLLAGYFLNPDSMLYFSHGRSQIWAATIRAWWDGQRLLGFGPGSFRVFFADTFQPKDTYGIGKFIQAHSDPVQWIFEFGFPGVITLALFLFVSVQYYRRFLHAPLRCIKKSQIAAECAFVAIMTNCLANFPWQLAPMCLIGMMSACILLKSLENDTIG